MDNQTPPLRKPSARIGLLDAAFGVIRAKGYSATTVDDLCAAAGVTKGAFFHHFKSKDDLAVAAAQHWSAVTGAMFAAAEYHRPDDPLARIMGYLDLRAALLQGSLADYTCLVGTMLQETYETVPVIGAASYAAITDHAATLEADFAAAMDVYRPPDAPSAASLALYTQTVLQGAFVLAKGAGGPTVVQDAIGHLRRYLTLLFNHTERRPDMNAQPDKTKLMHGVIPYIPVDGAEAAIGFYRRAFGAEQIGESVADPAGRVMNASLAINGGVLMLMDHFPEAQTEPVKGVTMQLIIRDGDMWWKRAVDAGCTVTKDFTLEFWGDRYGRVRDPFGIDWAFNEPGAGK